jgi:TPR repeat protein
MYEEGRGARQTDDAAAVKWYKLAAERGDVRAQEKLVVYYQNESLLQTINPANSNNHIEDHAKEVA